MKRILGIEFGSTRIKAVLTDEHARVLATGGYDWENILTDGLWSYPIEQVWVGLRAAYKALSADYGQPITTLDAIGISGMMHGYLAFDKDEHLLAPFRTWRNTNAKAAAEELTEAFSFHVPMRWSVSQYYQSVLDGAAHVGQLAFLTTLAGYVHYKLTGKKVLGINDASGMFPIGEDRQYDEGMLAAFQKMLDQKNVGVCFADVLPTVLCAGENAGTLTAAGALLLDESGTLRPGIPFCPPEGDMGTGMICTDSVRPKTANSSLGTSANITVVLEKPLAHYYPEIDVIETPDGFPAALVHANTCTSVIDRWVGVFEEVIALSGGKISRAELFPLLFRKAAESDARVGDVAGYNYLAGEPLAGTSRGVPAVFFPEEGRLTLANFMQAEIYAAIATLGLGLDLLGKENVGISAVCGHGGIFKTPVIGQTALSALVKAPVTVMKNAGEGGAWGIALLALYLFHTDLSLPDFLDGIFADTEKSTLSASAAEQAKFDVFMDNYKKGLAGERALSEAL